MPLLKLKTKPRMARMTQMNIFLIRAIREIRGQRSRRAARGDPIRQGIHQLISDVGILASRSRGHVKRVIRIGKQLQRRAIAQSFTERLQ
jgi:hypothetical protein